MISYCICSLCVLLHSLCVDVKCAYLHIFIGQGAGLSVAGRVDSGHVQVGENILVLPAQEAATIKGMC